MMNCMRKWTYTYQKGLLVNPRDWNEICAKCGEDCGNGHNTERGCLFVKGSGRKAYRPGQVHTYCPPRFYHPTRLTDGKLSHNTITFEHGEEEVYPWDGVDTSDLKWKPCPTKSVNKECGTCHEPFPYDPLPSNRPDGKTDCYRCKTMKGVFVS